MKKLLSLAAAAGLALSLVSAVHAADAPAAKPVTAQQGKMATCNKDATGKTGDDRKAFMKECLSAGGAPAAAAKPATQQEKMKTCNADAKTKALKGDDRKSFMSSCLSNKPAA
ncbi:PsiF family protein [Xylophilus sp. GW821-FHT01B05]